MCSLRELLQNVLLPAAYIGACISPVSPCCDKMFEKCYLKCAVCQEWEAASHNASASGKQRDMEAGTQGTFLSPEGSTWDAAAGA